MAKRNAPTPVKSYAPPAPSENGHVPAIDVVVNVDALSWDDMYLVMSLDKDVPFTKDLVKDIRDMFNRVIEGGAAAVPVVHTQAVMEQIGLAIQRMGEAKNSAPA